jgi:hypothetical protein
MSSPYVSPWSIYMRTPSPSPSNLRGNNTYKPQALERVGVVVLDECVNECSDSHLRSVHTLV